MRSFYRVTRWFCVLAVVALAVPSMVAAERPRADKLLPEDTLAFIRIANVPELLERYKETAIGKIGGDERVKPIVSQLYGTLKTFYEQIEERVGVPLDRLLTIPQGELCIAVVGPEEGGRPQLIALVDVGDHLPQAKILLERGQEELVAQGGSRNEERLGDITMSVLDPPGGRGKITLLEKDSTIVVGSDTDLVKQLLKVWNGEDVRTLSENRHFTSIMNKCGANRKEPPHAMFYANPLELIRKAGGGSSAVALATMTAVGLDGIQAVGGAMTIAVDEFDGIADAHLLLKPPHEGVIKMIAIEPGETTPEPWVPRDAVTYMTVNWDLEKTYAELIRLVELFRGEGSWERDIVKRMSERLDIDFEKDLIENLEGRLTHVTWTVKPIVLNSQSNLVGVKLKDPAAAKRTLDKIMGKFPQVFKQQTFGGVVYYQIESRRPPRGNFDAETMRLPDPSFCVLGDYLVFSDASKCVQQAIMTKSGSSPNLANELDYKLIASKISRHLGEAEAGMISFNRPEESLRHMYMLATSPTMRSRLKDNADSNPLFKALNSALDDNPLPPFSVVAQYLAPGGAVITSDETGLHYTAFTLRRE